MFTLNEGFAWGLGRPSRCPTVTAPPRRFHTVHLLRHGMAIIAVRGVVFFVGRVVMDDFVFLVRRASRLLIAHSVMRFRMGEEYRRRYIAPDPIFRNNYVTVIRLRQAKEEVNGRPFNAYLYQSGRAFSFMLFVRVRVRLQSASVIDVVRPLVCLPMVTIPRPRRPFMM